MGRPVAESDGNGLQVVAGTVSVRRMTAITSQHDIFVNLWQMDTPTGRAISGGGEGERGKITIHGQGMINKRVSIEYMY